MLGLPLVANQDNRRRLRKDAYCPCGSKLKYHNCCLTRGIEYFRDKEGGIVRMVPMNNEMKEALIGTIDSYEEILCRKMVDDDPVFLEMLLYSEEERMEKSTEILKYAFGLSDAELYAYNKTKILVTKANKRHTPLKDIQKFNKALKEFQDIAIGKKKIKRDRIENLQDELENWVVRLIYLYALLLYKVEHSNDAVTISSSKKLTHAYLLFCLTKHTKTLKATRSLTTSYFNEDTFSLIRSMYETYLQFTTALHNPIQLEEELEAKNGLKTGTHFWEKNYIKNKKNGTIIKILNNKQRAALDKDFNHENIQIYYGLYEYLSFFVHPSLDILPHYLKEGNFSHNNNNGQLPVFFYIIFVNSLLLYDLLKLQFFSGQNQADIKHFSKQIIKLLITTLDAVPNNTPEIYNRLKKMSVNNILKP